MAGASWRPPRRLGLFCKLKRTAPLANPPNIFVRQRLVQLGVGGSRPGRFGDVVRDNHLPERGKGHLRQFEVGQTKRDANDGEAEEQARQGMADGQPKPGQDALFRT